METAAIGCNGTSVQEFNMGLEIRLYNTSTTSKYPACFAQIVHLPHTGRMYHTGNGRKGDVIYDNKQFVSNMLHEGTVNINDNIMFCVEENGSWIQRNCLL